MVVESVCGQWEKIESKVFVLLVKMRFESEERMSMVSENPKASLLSCIVSIVLVKN